MLDEEDINMSTFPKGWTVLHFHMTIVKERRNAQDMSEFSLSQQRFLVL